MPMILYLHKLRCVLRSLFVCGLLASVETLWIRALFHLEKTVISRRPDVNMILTREFSLSLYLQKRGSSLLRMVIL